MKQITKYTHPVLGERTLSDIQNFLGDNWEVKAHEMGFIPVYEYVFNSCQSHMVDAIKEKNLLHVFAPNATYAGIYEVLIAAAIATKKGGWQGADYMVVAAWIKDQLNEQSTAPV
jgi:hypothetical protein